MVQGKYEFSAIAIIDVSLESSVNNEELKVLSGEYVSGEVK